MCSLKDIVAFQQGLGRVEFEVRYLLDREFGHGFLGYRSWSVSALSRMDASVSGSNGSRTNFNCLLLHVLGLVERGGGLANPETARRGPLLNRVDFDAYHVGALDLGWTGKQMLARQCTQGYGGNEGQGKQE